MRSLDEFYRYIEKQEKALREQATQPVGSPASAGETSPEAIDDSEETLADKAPAEEFVPPPLPPKAPRPNPYASILPPEVLRADPPRESPPDKHRHLPAAIEPTTADVRYLMRGGITIPVKKEAEPAVPDIEAYIPALRDSAPEMPSPTKDVAAIDNGTLSPETTPAAPDYLPPIVEEQEPPLVADAPARVAGDGRSRRARRSDPSPPPSLSDGEAAALWGRLPRHIQLLVGMTEPQEEVAQKYYTRGFKESRRQLIERLLDPTLTLEDTARVLGVCPTTVRRYTNRGVLPHHRTVGQQRRFRLSDVLAFLEQSAEGAPESRKKGASDA